MKTVCIIQARMGSSRLPGKVLLPLNGHTVIQEVISRSQRIFSVDEVAVAVSDRPGNDILAEYVAGEGIRCIRGSEPDVLSRYVEAAKETEASIIVRVTADCPLISPELCSDVVLELKKSGADYASNIMPRTFPQGFDCEAFTLNTLLAANRFATSGPDREHVTQWMQRDDSVRRVNVRCRWPLEGRVTLDTVDDYRVICAAFGHQPYECLRKAGPGIAALRAAG